MSAVAAERDSAYGLRFSGLEDAGRLLQHGLDGWPLISVACRRVESVPAAAPPDERGGVAWLGEGRRILTDRQDASATFLTTRPLGFDDMVHPGLGHVAVHFGRWLGREVLHAGAFVASGVAWAVGGDSQDGKSSLLAALAAAGHPVMSDDSLVVEQGYAYAGPRCIDLRFDARRPPLGSPLERSRAGSRQRLVLSGVSTPVRLAGILHLGWGQELMVARLTPAERLRRLLPLRLPVSHPGTGALDLAALPAWAIERPRRWDALDATREQIEQLVS